MGADIVRRHELTKTVWDGATASTIPLLSPLQIHLLTRTTASTFPYFNVLIIFPGTLFLKKIYFHL